MLAQNHLVSEYFFILIDPQQNPFISISWYVSWCIVYNVDERTIPAQYDFSNISTNRLLLFYPLSTFTIIIDLLIIFIDESHNFLSLILINTTHNALLINDDDDYGDGDMF